jgi:hypothetical protein
LLASLQIRGPQPVSLEDDRIDLTLVDLDQKQSRWLAELVDRETVFQQPWEVANPGKVEQVVDRLLQATNPRVHQPALRTLPALASPGPSLGLPGQGALILPKAETVETVSFTTPPINWWIEVERIEGPGGFENFAFPFAWKDRPRLMSEGETWTVIVVVDQRGMAISLDGSWEKENDPRTEAILQKIRAQRFPALSAEGPLRIWRLQARLVNRPIPE